MYIVFVGLSLPSRAQLIVLQKGFWTIVVKKRPRNNPRPLMMKKEVYFLMNFVLMALPLDSTCIKYMPWLYLEQSTLKVLLLDLPSNTR